MRRELRALWRVVTHGDHLVAIWWRAWRIWPWMLPVILLSGCASGGGGSTPNPPPTPQPALFDLSIVVTSKDIRLAGATVTVDEHITPVNENGWMAVQVTPGDHYVKVAKDGYAPVEGHWTITRHTRKVVGLNRLAPPVSRLRINGRSFVNDQGFWRGRLVGPTSLLQRSAAERAPLLDDYARLGFTGVRVFAGALPWANQTAERARAELPGLLDELAQRGMYGYVSALTESKLYDVESHLKAIIAICEQHPNAFLEIANEPYHPTQADIVHDYQRLFDLAHHLTPLNLPFALGAPETDELDPAGHWPQPVAPFVTIHLDRSRDKWNQIRRLRELAGVSEGLRVPVVSGEPMGAAESSIPQRRESDPAFFFAMGALCRGFELGACAFHSEDGLNARPFGPVQRACAEAFIAGWRSIDTEELLAFKNATWADSPVASADFDHTVVRAFSYLAGARGWLVLVGLTGDPKVVFKNGWRDNGLIAERSGVQVRALMR